MLKNALVSSKNTDHQFKKTLSEIDAIDSDNDIDTIRTCTLQCFANV